MPSYEGSWWLAILVVGLMTTMRYDAQLASFLLAILLSPAPEQSAMLALLFLPLTYAVGVSAAALIHNASHGQFRIRVLNSIVGESAGLLLRTNFLGWKLVHYYHHIHTDDPEKDPHSPGKSSFWPYANSMAKKCVDYLDERHAECHQLPKGIQVLTSIVGTLLFAGIPFFWLLLLGPTLFAAIWLPICISGWWVFIGINYFSHPIAENGKNAAINLNEKWWHKVTNLFGFGVLYHDNHHANAALFNPVHFEKS